MKATWSMVLVRKVDIMKNSTYFSTYMTKYTYSNNIKSYVSRVNIKIKRLDSGIGEEWDKKN